MPPNADQGRKPDFKRASDEALRLVAKYGYREPPIDPEKIAEKEGVRVIYASFEGDAANEYNGFFRLEDLTIVVNDEISSNRITFTIAHELAHYILHQPYIRSNDYTPLPRRDKYTENKPIEEIEADTFAANLLIPLSMLDRYKNVASEHELSRLFFVSEEAIANRLDLLRRFPQLARNRPRWR